MHSDRSRETRGGSFTHIASRVASLSASSTRWEGMDASEDEDGQTWYREGE